MKQVISNGKSERAYVLDLHDVEDARIWSKIDRHPGCSMQAGNLTVTDYPTVGRSAQSTSSRFVLFDPFMTDPCWTDFCAPDSVAEVPVPMPDNLPGIGTVLYTRDGRRYSNGIITGMRSGTGATVYDIETDFGNVVQASYVEICERWYCAGNRPNGREALAEWLKDRAEKIEKNARQVPDPIVCPYCSGVVQQVTAESTTVDGVTGVALAEWQCRGECDGRSFWV